MKGIFTLITVYTLLSFFNSKGFGQELQYSSGYANQVLRNPASTGASGYEYRAMANSRFQWNRLGGFNTYNVYIDHAIRQWAWGVNYTQDRVGNNSLVTQQVTFSASYWSSLTAQLKLLGGFGLRQTWISSRDNFLMVDDFNNGMTNGSTILASEYGANIDVGLMLMHPNFWLGGSLQDALNNPMPSLDRSFITSGSTTGDYRGTLNLQGGIGTSKLIKNWGGSASFLYWRKGRLQQSEIRVISAYNAPKSGYRFLLSTGYRGFLRSAENLRSGDSFVYYIGVVLPKDKIHFPTRNFRSIMTVGYSYDMTVSALEGSGGAHEISLVIRFSNHKRQSYWRTTTEPLRAPIYCPMDETFADQIYN